MSPTCDVLWRAGHEMAALRSAVLSGYILKRGSPSCGLECVKVYRPNGMAIRQGMGMSARAFTNAFPHLPVEEEGRLMDPVLRENFIQRVYVYHRWQRLCAGGLTAGKLVRFHSEHKFLVMAHSESHCRQLGRLVANPTGDCATLGGSYLIGLMIALKQLASRRRHSNVLWHLMGYLKRVLDTNTKAELGDLIESYRIGRIPLVVPLTLLRHYLRRHPISYALSQRYLEAPRQLPAA